MRPHQFQPTDLFPSLSEAREWLQKANKTGPGALCPCCNQFDKIYNRPINISCVKVLANLYRYTRIHGPAYYHYTKFQVSRVGWEFACFFRLLELVERAQNTETMKKTSGMYAITQDGMAFVENKIAIPERLLLYHDQLVGTLGQEKFIRQFWPTFDYEKLMQDGSVNP